MIPQAQAARTTHLVFANGAIHAHCTWTQGPQSPDESILQIEWKDGVTHNAIEPPGAFRVALFMPEMGHGSAPTQLERMLNPSGNAIPGAYRVTSIYFTMPGAWLVNVTLKFNDGHEETQAIHVQI